MVKMNRTVSVVYNLLHKYILYFYFLLQERVRAATENVRSPSVEEVLYRSGK